MSPGGSSTVHIYTQTIHRTTQNKQYLEQHNNLGECGPCPFLVSYTLAFALQLRKKCGKTSVRVAEDENDSNRASTRGTMTVLSITNGRSLRKFSSTFVIRHYFWNIRRDIINSTVVCTSLYIPHIQPSLYSFLSFTAAMNS